ncbi:MAG: CBS domain-containing protein [Candidatus Aenigmatarchaeota archaeon]
MTMLVKDIMNKDVEKATVDMTVSEAAAMMSEKNVEYLIVVKDARLAGIVTEDDIIKKVVGKDRQPKETTVGDIMVSKVVHIGPENSLEDAAEVMTENKIEKLPVVVDHKLLGIVTASDVVAAEPKMMEQLGELVILARKQKSVAG